LAGRDAIDVDPITSVPGVAHVPSFEIVTGAHPRSSFFAEDLRSVTPDGIAAEMQVRQRVICDEELLDAAS